MPTGIVLIEGLNGEGKSNLLEAIYMMAISKSPRAKHERELVNWDLAEGLVHVQIALDVNLGNSCEHLQIDLQCQSTGHSDVGVQYSSINSIRKNIKINHVSKTPAELIGHFNAVLFTADDLDLAYGSPSIRRRYIDILISKIDPKYLNSLQKYQNIVRTRNALLKAIRLDKDRASELDFWDRNLSEHASYILHRRSKVISDLSDIAKSVYSELSTEENVFLLNYRCTIPFNYSDPKKIHEYEFEISKTLTSRRETDISQTVTSIGPHRDDIELLSNNLDAGKYSSRGQVRSMILAMKIAEAMYLSEMHGDSPVLLFDDILSELDEMKRRLIFDKLAQYGQCIVTTAEIAIVPKEILAEIQHLRLDEDEIQFVTKTDRGFSKKFNSVTDVA